MPSPPTSSIPSVIKTIVSRTQARLAAHPPDEQALHAQAAQAPKPRDIIAALQAPGRRIIAEIKRSSPSLGAIATDADPLAIASTYESAGAAAISVLTEPERFGGSFTDLAQVSDQVHIPTLCKDFIVDPRQILMARAHGASLVLLIVAALDDRALVTLRETIESYGMQALVEVHDAHETRRAIDSGAQIIGVNNRNLHTLEIDLAVSEALAPLLEGVPITISESGIYTPADIQRLSAAGYRRFLIGSSLMRAPDPAALLRSLIA